MAARKTPPPVQHLGGTTDKFWSFSQVNQWGTHWCYSEENIDHLRRVSQIVKDCRACGINGNIHPRIVHMAQLVIWRFYMKNQVKENNINDVMNAAFECSEQIQDLNIHPPQFDRTRVRSGEIPHQVNLINELHFYQHAKHPTDYIKQFIRSIFTAQEMNLTLTIISDSFLSPCCLMYPPEVIAEGAVVMAAAILDQPDTVVPKTTESLAFINDMKIFYEENS